MTPAWDSPWLLAAAIFLLAVVVLYGLTRLRRRRGGEGRSGGRGGKRRSTGRGPPPRRPIRSDEEWEEQFRRSLAAASGSEELDTSPPGGPSEDGPREEAEPPSEDGPERNGADASASLSGEAAVPAPTANGAAEGNHDGSRGAAGPSAPTPALELLPGRLHPLRGYRGHDLHFVSQPGPNRFTLGSGKAEGRHHVQIRAPGVGGVHAAMEYADGRWYVANRSEADPVHVNGAPLDDGEPHLLSPGDRIEMGEVSFLFLES